MIRTIYGEGKGGEGRDAAPTHHPVSLSIYFNPNCTPKHDKFGNLFLLIKLTFYGAPTLTKCSKVLLFSSSRITIETSLGLYCVIFWIKCLFYHNVKNSKPL